MAETEWFYCPVCRDDGDPCDCCGEAEADREYAMALMESA